VAHLEVQVVRIGERPELHLLELRGFLFGAVLFLRQLVAILPVVDDATDGRARGGRDLDEVKPRLLGPLQGVLDLQNAELLAVRSDDPYFADPDFLIDPKF